MFSRQAQGCAKSAGVPIKNIDFLLVHNPNKKNDFVLLFWLVEVYMRRALPESLPSNTIKNNKKLLVKQLQKMAFAGEVKVETYDPYAGLLISYPTLLPGQESDIMLTNAPEILQIVVEGKACLVRFKCRNKCFSLCSRQHYIWKPSSDIFDKFEFFERCGGHIIAFLFLTEDHAKSMKTFDDFVLGVMD